MEDITELSISIILVLVVLAVGLFVFAETFLAIGVTDTNLQVNVTDNGTAVSSGQTVQLYDASNDTRIENQTTDSNGTVTYTSVREEEVYVETGGYQSDNVTLDDGFVSITVDTGSSTTTVDRKVEDTFEGAFDDIRTQVPVIIGLILVLPVVAVGSAAIFILRSRFRRNKGGR